MELQGSSKVVQRRTDIEYLSSMFFQLFESCATNVESTFEINIHHSSKPVWRQFIRRAKKVSGCSIHYHVNLAKMIDCGRDCIFDLLALTHVSRKSKCASAILVYQFCRRFKVFHLSTN